MKTTRTMKQTKRIILWLPERTIFYGDIVCEGKELDVYIEEGCKVTGDINANNVITGNNVTIIGNIFVKGNVILGERCYVMQAIAGENISVGDGTRLLSIDAGRIARLGSHVTCEDITAGHDMIAGRHCQINEINTTGSIKLGDFTEVSTKIASLDKVCLGKNVIIPIEALPQLSDDKIRTISK